MKSNLFRHRAATLVVAASVALITFIVFLPALRNDFVNWDDGEYVYENPFIRSLDTALLKSAFLEFHESNWHPLTWICHSLDYALWGINPFGHHLTSNLLHALDAFLVVYVVISLFAVQQGKGTTGRYVDTFHGNRAALIVGATTGLLFGIHPLHVESTAWVSERKDLLCALFFLLSILAYIRFAGIAISKTSSGHAGSRISARYYLLSVGFFLFALLSKPMAVSVPLVLLILDWYPFERIRSLKTLTTAFFEKLPFLVLALLSSIVTLYAQAAGEAMTPVEILPLSTRGIIAAGSIVTYLWKMTVPLNLVPFYPYPKNVSLLSIQYGLPVVLVFGITIACVIFIKKEKIWLSVWSYYLVTLLPVLGIVQVGMQSMADRYTYLPSLGPFLLAGVLSGRIYEKSIKGQSQKSMAFVVGSVLAVFLLAFLPHLTRKQLLVWKNGFVFWNYVIERQPGKAPVAHNNLGEAYISLGQPDMAMEHFKIALRLKPDYADALYNLGNLFVSKGDPDAAIQQYRTALQFKPRDPRIYHNLGATYMKKGKPEMAIEPYRMALGLSPFDVETLYHLGNAYMAAGMADRAVAHYQMALKQRPDLAGAHFNLGLIYLQTGSMEMARREIELGLRLEPSNERARQLLNGIISKREPVE